MDGAAEGASERAVLPPSGLTSASRASVSMDPSPTAVEKHRHIKRGTILMVDIVSILLLVPKQLTGSRNPQAEGGPRLVATYSAARLLTISICNESGLICPLQEGVYAGSNPARCTRRHGEMVAALHC